MSMSEAPIEEQLVEALAERDAARKEASDARAERMIVESALVDALGALQFYARDKHWIEDPRVNHLCDAERDRGVRARVTVNRLFDRLVDFARIQALRSPHDDR